MQKLDYDISEVAISGAISSEFTKYHCQYIMHFSARVWVKAINRGGQIQGQKRVDFSFSKPDTSVGHDLGSCLSESAMCGDEETLSPLDNKHCPSGLAEASKKIKQHCKSFESFEKKNPLLVVFLLSMSDIHPCVY